MAKVEGFSPKHICKVLSPPPPPLSPLSGSHVETDLKEAISCVGPSQPDAAENLTSFVNFLSRRSRRSRRRRRRRRRWRRKRRRRIRRGRIYEKETQAFNVTHQRVRQPLSVPAGWFLASKRGRVKR